MEIGSVFILISRSVQRNTTGTPEGISAGISRGTRARISSSNNTSITEGFLLNFLDKDVL